MLGACRAHVLTAALLIVAMPAPTAVGGSGPLGEGHTQTVTVPAFARTADRVSTGLPGARLLPDLVALPARQPRVQVRNDGRRLRFTSSLGNIGAGPIEVRPNRNHRCPRHEHNSTQIIYRDGNANGSYQWRKDTDIARHRAGCMVFHPLHNHWHFKASARYTLLEAGTPDRVVVSARRKVSFCLRDTARVPERYGARSYPEIYGHCTRHSPQGISVGWMDVYQSFLAGQSLRLPRRLPDGLYCLETVVDPIDQLMESDNENNSSLRAVAIRGNRVAVRDTARCREGPPEPTPAT